MAVKLLWNGIPQFEDSSGNPYSSARLFFYSAGSSTKVNTYSDSGGITANPNPITLNSSGYPAVSGNIVQIWGTVGQSYKIGLAAPGSDDPPASFIWSADNVTPINDTTVTQDQWVAGPAPTYVSATSFTLVGDQTTTFHIGRRIKTTNTGGTVYSTIIASSFGASTTVTVVNDSGTLDSGLSAVSYGLLSAANPSSPAIGDEYLCQGRLTLTSGTPVTTSDVTAAETVYFAPYKGNKIDLYDATAARWVRYKFTELSLDVPDATQMNDVFIYNNSGTLTLEAVAWSSDTARATALTTQDGVYVKSGATGRRYLGSFYGTTAGNGQTEDSLAKRYLWNYYNRVPKAMRAVDTTNSWNYTTATFRQANANTANQLDMAIGVSEDPVEAIVSAVMVSDQAAATVTATVGIGVDSTSTNSAQILINTNNPGSSVRQTAFAEYVGFPGIGKHILPWLEQSTATGTTTWIGDAGGTVTQSGIVGTLMG